MNTQILTWAAFFKRRFTEKLHVMELTRNSPKLTALDLIKPRTEFGWSLYNCNEDIVWITEFLLEGEETKQNKPKKPYNKTGVDYLKGGGGSEEVRGGYSCWLMQCSTCIFSHRPGKLLQASEIHPPAQNSPTPTKSCWVPICIFEDWQLDFKLVP